MIGLSAKLPGTRSGSLGASGDTGAGAAGAGGMARWHAPATNTISSAAQSLDRNGNSSRRCIVEPTSWPIALLLFSTGIVGNRAFRNARAARGPARVDVGGKDTGMVERPPAIRKPGARTTCHATWRTRAALAA